MLKTHRSLLTTPARTLAQLPAPPRKWKPSGHVKPTSMVIASGSTRPKFEAQKGRDRRRVAAALHHVPEAGCSHAGKVDASTDSSDVHCLTAIR